MLARLWSAQFVSCGRISFLNQEPCTFEEQLIWTEEAGQYLREEYLISDLQEY